MFWMRGVYAMVDITIVDFLSDGDMKSRIYSGYMAWWLMSFMGDLNFEYLYDYEGYLTEC